MVNGHLIEQVMNYNYLEIETSTDRTNEEKNIMLFVEWRNKFMSPENQIRETSGYLCSWNNSPHNTNKKNNENNGNEGVGNYQNYTWRQKFDTLKNIGVQNVVRWTKMRRSV